MDMNSISALDKMQVKKLGITVEEYKEKEQTARTIWYQLISEGKVYNPFYHVPSNKRLVAVGTVGIIALFYIFLLVYNAVANIGAETKGMWILFAISTVIYIIGEFTMYHHDMKEFEKRVNLIATWEDTPCKVKKGMADSINGALGFTRENCGCCYTKTSIPFCSIHAHLADDGTKTYSLEFSGLPDGYKKSVPLEKMEFNYIANTMQLQLKVYLQEYADYLIETEMLEE